MEGVTKETLKSTSEGKEDLEGVAKFKQRLTELTELYDGKTVSDSVAMGDVEARSRELDKILASLSLEEKIENGLRFDQAELYQEAANDPSYIQEQAKMAA